MCLLDGIQALKQGNSVKACAVCEKGGPVHQCSRCKTIAYCTQQCQLADWKNGHKELCDLIAARESSGGPENSSHTDQSLDLIGDFLDERESYGIIYKHILPRLDTPSFFKYLKTHKGIREFILEGMAKYGGPEMYRERQLKAAALREISYAKKDSPIPVVITSRDSPYSDDKEVAVAEVSRHPVAWRFLSDRLQLDPEIAGPAFNNHTENILHIPPAGWRIPAIVRAVCSALMQYRRHQLTYTALPRVFWTAQGNRMLVDAFIGLIPRMSKDELVAIPPASIENPYVMAALREQIYLFVHDHLHFPEEVRDNDLFMLTLLSINGDVYVNDLTDRQKRSKEFMLAAVTINKHSLWRADDQIKDDINVVDLAVSYNSTAFRYASLRLKDNTALAMRAVGSDARNYQFVSDRLKGAYEVAFLVATSLTRGLFQLEFFPEELRDDASLMLCFACVRGVERNKNIKYVLGLVSQRLRADKDFMRSVISAVPTAYTHMDLEMRNDYNLALLAVSGNGVCWFYLPERLKKDKRLRNLAISNGYERVIELGDGPCDDEDAMYRAVLERPAAISRASDRLKDNDRIVYAAIAGDIKYLEYASERLRRKYGGDQQE